jgi:hypothetical protein
MDKNFEIYLTYIEKFIKRKGTDKFIKWLKTTDIASAPASTKYHLSEDGGLIKHSINVMRRLIKLVQMEYGTIENSPYTKETIAFVALFHDISKVNFYEKFERSVKVKGTWEQSFGYKVRDNRVSIGFSGENSVYILSKFFDIGVEEASAIRWAEGASSSTDSATIATMYDIYGKSRLCVLLHIADLLAISVDESGGGKLLDVCVEDEEDEQEDFADEQDSLKPTPGTEDCPF